MEFMSITEAAKKWGISNRRIQVLCASNRIPGAFMLGSVWAIPSDAEKPSDARIKSGKYVGFSEKRRSALVSNERIDGITPAMSQEEDKSNG